MPINKNCNKCDKLLINVHPNTKYCDTCRKELSVENYKRQNKRISENLHSDEQLRNNFFKVVKEPCHLTNLGFNQNSSIITRVYVKYYKMNWFEIVSNFGKSDILLNYITTEYKKYINKTNKQGFNDFIKNHNYINHRLIQEITEDKIRDLVNVKKLRYTDEEYAHNFILIINKIGRPPLFHEFIEMTSINFNAYTNHLNLKGKIYDNIVKHYVDEEEFNKYLITKKLHKSKVGSETGKLGAVYSDEDYEKEFHRVFELCLNEYGETPPKRLFNQLSKIDESAYRGKYNCSWIDVCEMYGYKIDKTANRSEKTALETVKSILNESYIPQHTFDWLVGVNNFPLFCDGYYPKHKLVIEFDGIQHREPVKMYGGEEKFKTLQANDQVKDKLIPKNGLKLVRILSDEPFWNKEYIRNKLVQNNAI